MFSGFQPSEPQSLGLCCSHGAPVSKPSPAGTTDTYDTSPVLRFNSLTVDELSDELDRRTKETQRLQEQVEHATKAALEKFGCTYDVSNTSGPSSHVHRCTDCDPPGDIICPDHSQGEILPRVSGLDILDQDMAQKQITFPRKDVLENAIDNCSQQLPGLQTHRKANKGAFSFDKAIVNLQTRLHEVRMEKDVLSALRLVDSRKHVDQMEKMLCMLEELQNIKRATDQKLQDSEDEAVALNKKVETLEDIIKETYNSLLSQEKHCGNSVITSPNSARDLCQPSPAVKLTEDINNEKKLPKSRFLSTDHLSSQECHGVNEHKQRVKEVIASLDQEMAVLSEKLSSSKHDSESLSDKLELLKKLMDRQSSLHQCQVSDLESTLSSHKDKVSCLEQQLLQVQSQLRDVQRERDLSSQQTQDLQSQLSQLKKCSEQKQGELQVEVKALRGFLGASREQLCRSVEEKNSFEALLNQRNQEGRKAQELLREKDGELQLKQQEAQQNLIRCQALRLEGERLRLKLDDREKLINSLRSQIESSDQLTMQHSHTIGNLQQENGLLSNRLNQHKLDIQQLRAELDKHRSDLADSEHKRQQLQASLAEQSQRVQEETLEKKHLSTQLEIQRIQLLALAKDHEDLQQLHSCKNDENEGVLQRLRSQLRKAHDELDQVRSTLKTLGGADGHGLQLAMDMQKEITARRQQVDSLQGEIQHLEGTVEKLHQEKMFQSLEHQHQLKQLTSVREEKKRLSNELEALRSKDQELRHRIGKLEEILHKMSESFADCQGFIQLQEQEFYRLKLQHTLDLKGQNLHSAPKVISSDLNSPNPVLRAQHAYNTQMKTGPAQELRSLIKELRGVISENYRPHTDNTPTGSSVHRRRSAPERLPRTTVRSVTDQAGKFKADPRLRRKPCSSKVQFLDTAELNGELIKKDAIADRCVISVPATSFTQLLSLGRRSPVHSLLTSDPNS